MDGIHHSHTKGLVHKKILPNLEVRGIIEENGKTRGILWLWGCDLVRVVAGSALSTKSWCGEALEDLRVMDDADVDRSQVGRAMK
jgi:hypothetical protein